MVAVTLILDGASEPLGPRLTSLERARTPVLDRLSRSGALTRLRTIPPGLPAGSETAIPVLLGWAPPAPVDRGMLEAAARQMALELGQRAWRVDVIDADGTRADAAMVGLVAEDLRSRLTSHVVRRIGGHRLLLTGPAPLPIASGDGLYVWPEGIVPPSILGPETVLIAARGAAAGVGRMMGARVVVPAGATGSLDTDLVAKADAAARAIQAGAGCVVVHVGAPDEAGHRRDPDAKSAALERIDRELLAPLTEAVSSAAGTLRVCPDHGCDPGTGAHHGAPVPCLTWTPGCGDRGGNGRLTERAVSDLPVVDAALSRNRAAA